MSIKNRITKTYFLSLNLEFFLWYNILLNLLPYKEALNRQTPNLWEIPSHFNFSSLRIWNLFRLKRFLYKIPNSNSSWSYFPNKLELLFKTLLSMKLPTHCLKRREKAKSSSNSVSHPQNYCKHLGKYLFFRMPTHLYVS